MAKWGEGDPRWIVEERPDATNVNNWHWTEKNADSWSKMKFESLFKGLVLDDPSIGKVEITEIEKCEGEARVNNRKSKLIFFYEWVIELKWSGKVNNKNEALTGSISIPNMSEEHTDMRDVDIEVTAEDKSSEACALKQMIFKGKGASLLREQLQEYVTALRNEFSKGLILPASNINNTSIKSTTTISKAQFNNYSATTPSKVAKEHVSNNGSSGVKLHLKDIQQTETFNCSGEELYNVLTQKSYYQAFFGSEIKMDEVAAPGVQFSFLNGNILGEFVELKPYLKIVKKWRINSWPEGHYSRVEITIAQAKDETKLTLSQTGIPEKEIESTQQGWMSYYWIPIKRCFGYGQVKF
uniref:Activator of 90 kDa heat shock protein ATPase homolog 1 n=1 Tax=Lepeophtheirus salmonis TaxID=72036 RepID=D3PJW3_LEPSM|nr:Activator of 90 kDa heat shock protein ATPase homolog 1 [Lepeophtheirus salmonis]